MRPVGARFPIFHTHAFRPDSDSISVGPGRMVLGMAERTGNIWMAEWKSGW